MGSYTTSYEADSTVALGTRPSFMEHIVEAKDLVKVYPPDIKAVDGISFYVDRGEIFGFLGPNGAGKSTTIKVLITLISKTSGEVAIDGINLDDDPKAIRRIIGYASQDVGVDDDLTGRENLFLQCEFHHIFGGAAKTRVEELIQTVGLEKAADRRAGTYSGGMRKRLDLATSLVSRPKILFMDEPTTGLDPQSRQAIWEYIRKLNRDGMTIFLTTQYMEEADQLASRLCIVDQGRIVAQGKPAELKAQIAADQIQITLVNGKDPVELEKAMEAVKAISGIKEVKGCEANMMCEEGFIAYAVDGPSLVSQIVRSLEGVGAGIKRLTLSSPTLDDVFLKFTGKTLRVEDARPPPSRLPGRRRRRG